MHLPSTGRANARRVCLGRTLAAALACALTAGRATAQDVATPGATPAADLSSAASAPTKDAVLAEEARWLAGKVPKLTATRQVIQVGARIGGTDVMPTRHRVVRAKLDRCTLVIERLFEGQDVDDLTGGVRIRHIIPLKGADPASLTVRQRQSEGSPISIVSSQNWHLVLTLLDGAIITDVDEFGDRRSRNGGELDLLVASEAAGLEIETHLRSAILACQ
jgi:hypothetical protein